MNLKLQPGQTFGAITKVNVPDLLNERIEAYLKARGDYFGKRGTNKAEVIIALAEAALSVLEGDTNALESAVMAREAAKAEN